MSKDVKILLMAIIIAIFNVKVAASTTDAAVMWGNIILAIGMLLVFALPAALNLRRS